MSFGSGIPSLLNTSSGLSTPSAVTSAVSEGSFAALVLAKSPFICAMLQKKRLSVRNAVIVRNHALWKASSRWKAIIRAAVLSE